MFNVLMEASTQTATGNPQSNVFAQLFPFILMFGILYLLIIRPQRKRQKETQNMLTNLKVKDVVVTNGGIIGKITNIKKEKNIVVLRVDEASKTKIEFQKNAIVGIIKDEEKKA